MTVEITIRRDDGSIVAGPMIVKATVPYVWRTVPDFPLLESASNDPLEKNDYAMYAFTYQPVVVLRPKLQPVSLNEMTRPRIL